MCATPCVVGIDNTVFTLSFENHTNNGLEWGYPFWVEYYDVSEWKKVDLNLCFPLPLFSLKSGEKKEEEMGFSAEQLNHTTGKYRIGKDFGIRVSGTPKVIILYAEFEVVGNQQ